MLTYSTTTDTAEDDINPAEMARLEAVVQKTLVGCLTTCVQSSVTSAEILLGEDWSQEGRAMLRRFGIEPCATPMLASTSEVYATSDQLTELKAACTRYDNRRLTTWLLLWSDRLTEAQAAELLAGGLEAKHKEYLAAQPLAQ